MSLVIPSQHKARQARTSEEHAWDTLYRTKHDPTAATEVVEYLDSEPEVRKSHLGLYLCCRQTVRAHEARRVRTQRIAAFLQLALHLVLVVPLRVVIRALRGSGDVAVELMPQVPAPATVLPKSEPATRRIRKLVKRGEFAQAKQAFPKPAGVSDAATSATPEVPPDGKGAEAFSTIR